MSFTKIDPTIPFGMHLAWRKQLDARHCCNIWDLVFRRPLHPTHESGSKSSYPIIGIIILLFIKYFLLISIAFFFRLRTKQVFRFFFCYSRKIRFRKFDFYRASNMILILKLNHFSLYFIYMNNILFSTFTLIFSKISNFFLFFFKFVSD